MTSRRRITDGDLLVREKFDRRVREELLDLIDDELVAEHAGNPFGRHSDRLERVLVYLRGRPIAGKYVIVCTRPYSQYRIGRLTGVKGERPEFVDDVVYGSIDEAEHAVFLRRVEELRA